MPQELEAHLKDASHFKGHAQRIIHPASEEEVALLLRQAQKEKIPITISGAGTGLTGARVPLGGWVLCTERMNQIQEVRWDGSSLEGTVRVQPGVSLQGLEAALEPQGLFYPPDPGEKAASVGGTIATNASGSRSLKYGPTRRFVRGLRVVLPNGELLDVRRGQIKAAGGILRLNFSDGTTAAVPLPAYDPPKVKKNAAGYFSDPQMDLVDLFIGAEGTLGVVTLAELIVLRKPESLLSGLLFFSSEEDCFRFAMQVKGSLNPRVLEFFDSHSLALLAEKHPDTPEGAKAALLFEQECRQREYDALLREWLRRSEAAGARPSDCWYSRQPEDHRLFRRYRYDLPVLVNERVALSGFRKLGTDFAVPEEQGEAMFRFYLEELPNAGSEYLIWGHLGDHHLHVNLLAKTAEEFRQAQDLYARMARKAIELGGTVSGEHGIGKARIPYLEMMVGREGLKQMARVKKALDPNGILNPGDIFPVELLHEILSSV